MPSALRPALSDPRIVSFREKQFTMGSIAMAAEISPAAIVLTTLAAEVLYANRHFLEMFEIPSIESISNADLAQVCKGALSPEFLSQLAKDGQARHQTVGLRQQGRSLTLVCSATRVCAESGYPKWLSIALLPVADDTQQRSCAAVTESLVTQWVGAFGTWSVADSHDPRHAVLTVSTGFSALMGLHPHEEARPLRDWLRQVHHDDRPDLTAAMAQITREGGEYSLRYRIAIEGTERVMHGCARAVTHGTQCSIVGLERDITESARRSDTEQLHQRLFQTMSEQQETPAFAIDPQIRLTWFNSAFAVFVSGYGRQARVGDALESSVGATALLRRLQRNLRRALQGERRAEEFEVNAESSNSRRCDFTFSPVRDDTGKVVAVLVATTMMPAASHHGAQ